MHNLFFRNFLEDEIQLLRQNSKDIVCLIIKSEELLHEKLDEIIDNQLSGCNLSQYGLDATSGSFPGHYSYFDLSLIFHSVKGSGSVLIHALDI